MMIDDADFFLLFNTAMAVAKPVGKSTVLATSMDERFESLNIDSLDGFIIGMYLCDAFAVSEAKGKEMQPETVGQMRDFLVQNARVEKIDMEAALEAMK
jgi:acyl carrier protein